MGHFLYDVRNVAFSSAADNFRLIGDTGKNVVVCWKDSMELIDKLLREGPSYLLMKKLSRYIVNVNTIDFESLQKMGVITEKSEKMEGLFVIEYKEQYDSHVGLRIDSNWVDKELII